MTATAFIEALFNGLSNSSILILVALGLAITFGVMRVINMAHGEMLMLGAYTSYVVTDPKYLNLNLYWAIPISFLVVGLVGYLLEVGLIRYLYGRPLDTLLATWGVGLILQQSTRLLFGADLKPLDLPVSLRASWDVGGMTFPYYRWFILGITCLCLLAVYLWFFKTPFGLQIRAVTQNRAMASALGISTRRVDSLTFAFGTGLAGVAGCIVGHLYVVNPDMGTGYIVDAFMVVILGGMGQLAGTVVSGVVIGTATSLLAKIYSNDLWPRSLSELVPTLFPNFFPPMISEVNQQMAKVTVLLLVIAGIMVRPSGLFSAKERVYD